MNELSQILVSVVNSILFVALPVLVVAVINAVYAWGRVQWQNFKAAQPMLAEQVAYYARIGVEAAEQAGIKKLIDDKKAYAVLIATLWLDQKGLNGIDVALIEAEVERQVRALNNERQPLSFRRH
jgi:type II secretory pathway component PulK